MTFHYRIEAEENLVRITCTGNHSIEDLMRYVAQVNADPAFEVGMNTIADLSAAAFKLDYDQTEKFKEFVKQMGLSREKACKWALYAPTPASCDPAALFKLLLESDRIDVRIFQDKTDAEQWVADL